MASGYRRSAAAGTECGISSREETPTIRVSSQFVLLDALVADRKTRSTVGSLEAKDFLLKEAGIPQNISYISHDTSSLSVVFLFDLTETVEPVLQSLSQRAGELLGHLKPEDEVSVMFEAAGEQAGAGVAYRWHG